MSPKLVITHYLDPLQLKGAAERGSSRDRGQVIAALFWSPLRASDDGHVRDGVLLRDAIRVGLKGVPVLYESEL